MSARLRIEHHQVALRCPDADIDLAIRSHREAARVHLGGVHAAQVFHFARRGIVAHQLRVRIRAGVKLAVFANVELPEVILSGGGFADDFNALL